MILSIRLGIISMMLLAPGLAACTGQALPNVRSSASPSRPPTAAASLPVPLPTPTDYRSICDLESSVCTCRRGAEDPYCSDKLPTTLMRPLHLPQIGPGTSCPTTPGRRVDTVRFGTFALGPGPVYPGIGGQLDAWGDGWFGFKSLWFVAPSYDGPVLIRGARIDRSGLVGFGENPLIGHLVIPPGRTVNEADDGYRTAPGGTYVAAPGCYAWQVDGLTFSYVIVFGVDMRVTNTPG